MAECAADMDAALRGLFDIKFATLGSFRKSGGNIFVQSLILGIATIVQGAFS